MAVPSEVRRVQAAIDNNNRKELEWSLWYARMRQSVPSARPADVKYWSAIERQVQEILEPPPPTKAYPTRKKKKENRGLGFSPLPSETEVAEPDADIPASILALAETVYGGHDRAMAWLRTPNARLNREIPLSLLKTDAGLLKVEELLGQIDEGMFI